MALDGDEEEGQQPIAPNTVPALAQLANSIPDPGARDAISEAAARLNDHVQQRQIADANVAAGQNFDNDLGSFLGGLRSFVQDDPTGVHAAMSAVEPVVDGLVRSVPGHPEDQIDGHIEEMTRGMQRELASTAVTSAAEQHEGVARGLLAHPRIDDVLSDADKSSLSNYIGMQADARGRDAAAQQQQQAQLADTRANHSMFSYASMLYNPDSGATVFPPGWNQAVLADKSVTPQDTATLRQIHSRLLADGGAQETDPFVASRIVGDIASGNPPPARDVLQRVVTGDLTHADALHLSSLASDRGNGADDHAAGLANLLQQGRTAIMGADGENGAAGAAAYGRYVNWLLPAYKRTGAAGANPDPEQPASLFGRIGSFLPTGDDLISRAVGGVAGTVASLSDIFGTPRDPNAPDEVIGGSGPGAVSSGVYRGDNDRVKTTLPSGARQDPGIFGRQRTQSGDTVENPPAAPSVPVPLRQWPMYQSQVRKDET